ncbi:MAG: hypothetical protein Kow0074_05190 [Candidatus Zixiibacteriota bacterium]
MRNLTRHLLSLTLTVAMLTPSLRAENVSKASSTDSKGKSEGIEWLSYDEGLEKAKETGKPIVIDFYTDWCGYCKKMDRETFKDPKVISYMKENFISVRVNGESKKMVSHKGEQLSERSLTKAYRVSGFPTFWFLSSDGEPIGPAPGYKPTKSWLTLLEYVGGSHYKKMSFDTYVKSKASDG